MTSLAPVVLSKDFDTDPLAVQNKLNCTELDAQLAILRDAINAAQAVLNGPIRSDDTLADGIVRARMLHPEVVALIAAKGGWLPKVAVACASTANLVLSGEQTIDGVTTAASRVLVKDQTLPANNGIYVTGAGEWTRSTDADTAAELGYAFVPISAGTVNGSASWVCTVDVGSITLGTTALTWTQLSGLIGTVPLAKGGTGSTTAAGARAALGFSAAVDPFVTAATLAVARTALGEVAQSVASLAALKAMTGAALAGYVFMAGYASTGDGGGGLFRWVGADAATANDGTIVAPTAGGGRFYRIYGEEVNVRWFGATGDGVTNDTASIAATVTAAPVGSTVYFPKGSYLTTGFTVSKTLTIRGDGEGSILIASGVTAQIITVSGTAAGVVISDLRFNGTKTDESGGDQFGIRVLTGNDRGVIERCLFSGTGASTGLNIQIHLQFVNHWRVQNCHFERAIGTNPSYGYGVLVETCTYCNVSNCTGIQSATQGRHHVYLSAGSSNCTVRGNRFSNGTSEMISVYALEVQGWCENNIIEANVLTGSQISLNLGGVIGVTQKCRYNLVHNNLIHSNLLGNGILVQGGTGAADSRSPFNTVSNNVVAENGRVGIKLAGCDDCFVVGNNVYENSQASSQTYVGIEVSPNSANAPCNRNKLIGNICTGTTFQRAPWRVADASGVRPLDTVIRGGDSPKGGFKYAQDNGDRTSFDESYTINRRLTYADFSTAGVTNTAVLFVLGPGEKVESVVIKHEVAFTGGAIATYTLSVGVPGTAAKYAPAANVFQAAGAAVFQDANTVGIENMALVETNVIATATSGGANLNAATAGIVNVYVRVRRHALIIQ